MSEWPSREEDARAVRRTQAGDPDAFAPLVERYAPRLLRYFAAKGLDSESARDGVQETFSRAYQGLARYDGRAPFGGWLFGIAHNVRKQSQRERSRHAHAAIMPGDALVREEPVEALVQEERKAATRRALARLPERMRLVLQLRFVEGCSCAEIAETLGTLPGAVSPLIYRAKAALRTQAGREFGGHNVAGTHRATDPTPFAEETPK